VFTIKRASAVSACIIFAACSGGGAEDIAGPDPSELPPPASAYVYTATITLDSIRISNFEACDGRDFFGNAISGAFHYKVTARANDSDLGAASPGYGGVLGAALSRGPKGIIALGARKLTFSGLDVFDELDLEFSMIEWDGPFMDGVLKGQVERRNETPAAYGSDYRNANHLLIGNPATCGGTLFYELRVVGTLK
jgi:hypothetical protein